MAIINMDSYVQELSVLSSCESLLFTLRISSELSLPLFILAAQSLEGLVNLSNILFKNGTLVNVTIQKYNNLQSFTIELNNIFHRQHEELLETNKKQTIPNHGPIKLNTIQIAKIHAQYEYDIDTDIFKAFIDQILFGSQIIKILDGKYGVTTDEIIKNNKKIIYYLATVLYLEDHIDSYYQHEIYKLLGTSNFQMTKINLYKQTDHTAHFIWCYIINSDVLFNKKN